MASSQRAAGNHDLEGNGQSIGNGHSGGLMDGSAESPALQPRYLVALFRRDPSKDTRTDRRVFEGYQICWPDGEPASISLERFCQLGCRLLGLGKRMQGKQEQLVEMGVYPLPEGLEAPLTPTPPGVRCRRFYLMRENSLARVYFFNGSPTEVCFDVEHDDPRVLEWIGALDLPAGEQRWFDFTARTLGDPDERVGPKPAGKPEQRNGHSSR